MSGGRSFQTVWLASRKTRLDWIEDEGEEMIEGNVARVVNSVQLVLNRGINDGVTNGMVFAVVDSEGDDITDP